METRSKIEMVNSQITSFDTISVMSDYFRNTMYFRSVIIMLLFGSIDRQDLLDINFVLTRTRDKNLNI